MSTITFKGVIETLKKLDFQNSSILDLFHASKSNWRASFHQGKLVLCEPENPGNVLITAKTIGGRIKDLKPGPACKPIILAEVLRLAKELRAPHEHAHVLSRIMFSNTELKGSWRYKGLLQIIPCIQDIKIGQGLDWYNENYAIGKAKDSHGPPYPFLLEVSVPKLSNFSLQTQTGMKLLDSYEHMLCTFIRGVSTTILWPSDRQWIAIKSKEDRGIEYHLLHAGISNQRGGQYDSWSKFEGKTAPKYCGDDYLDSLPMGQLGELELPNDLEHLFDVYFSMEVDRKQRFLRSTYFFTLGQKLRPNSDLSVTNLTTAIECLFDLKKTQRDTESGKANDGPTKLFKSFMEKYAPVCEALIPRRDKLYAIRSNISHGSHSMVSDSAVFSLARDRDTHILMEWLSRKAIVGWLRSHDLKEIKTT